MVCSCRSEALSLGLLEESLNRFPCLYRFFFKSHLFSTFKMESSFISELPSIPQKFPMTLGVQADSGNHLPPVFLTLSSQGPGCSHPGLLVASEGARLLCTGFPMLSTLPSLERPFLPLLHRGTPSSFRTLLPWHGKPQGRWM